MRISSIYILPWAITLVHCAVVLLMLTLFFDIERMFEIWWTVPVGGVLAAVIINIAQFYILHNK